MNSYDFLAGCYDEFTTDVGYSAWADYIEAHFRRRGLPGKTVLDLACGTGSLTLELAQRGYEMIGVDLSPEMLAEAAEKNQDVDGIPPIFLCQSMDKLNLYGTIDACVCCLDSVNYVTDPKKLQKAFERVYLFLMPGAGEDIISKIEAGVRRVGSVSRALEGGLDARGLLEAVLSDFELEILETHPVEYRCYCNRDRVTRALISMGREELESLIQEQGQAELTCQFCDRVYPFTKEELEALLAKM